MKFLIHGVIVSILFCESAKAQINPFCAYKDSIDSKLKVIDHLIRNKVKLRDSSSYMFSPEWKYVKRDSSTIVLPDSCFTIMEVYVRFAWITKPAAPYLKLLDQMAAFNEPYNNSVISACVVEMVISNPDKFIESMCSNDFVNLEKYFYDLISESGPQSDYNKKIKKWLSENNAKKKTRCYKMIAKKSEI